MTNSRSERSDFSASGRVQIFYASRGSHFFSRGRTKNFPAAGGSHCWVRSGPTFLEKSRSGEKPFFDIGRAQIFQKIGERGTKFFQNPVYNLKNPYETQTIP